MKVNKFLQIGLIGSLTLGLAPFSPPHIVGKIKWIMGGAKGMTLMDWWDTVIHGTPWILLVVGLVVFFVRKEYRVES